MESLKERTVPAGKDWRSVGLVLDDYYDHQASLAPDNITSLTYLRAHRHKGPNYIE